MFTWVNQEKENEDSVIFGDLSAGQIQQIQAFYYYY